MFPDKMAGIHRLAVAARFRDFLPSTSTTKPCVTQVLYGRAIVQRDTCHERRLKPAAMLIGSLEIHVGRITQFRICREHRLMAHPGINPNIDRVAAMRGAFGQAEFASERGVVELEPNIGAALRNNVRQLANPRWIEDGLFIEEGVTA